jgi:aryl-alcohol dehydrogenase-like predicted oxidoreductase
LGIGNCEVPYNPLDCAVERYLLPLAHELNLGIVGMMPLGHGALVTHAPSSEHLAPLTDFAVHTWE